MKRLALIVAAAALLGGLTGAALDVALGGPSSTPSPMPSVSTAQVHAHPAAQTPAPAGTAP